MGRVRRYASVNNTSVVADSGDLLTTKRLQGNSSSSRSPEAA